MKISIAHDELVVPQRGLTAPGEPSGLAVPLELAGIGDVDLSLPEVSFDTVQHLVSAAAGDPATLWTPRSSTTAQKRGLRERLAKALDTIQGQSASHDW